MVPGEGGGVVDAVRYCLQHGDPKVTKHVLKKSKWNPTTKDAWRTNGAWRQDLLHLIK